MKNPVMLSKACPPKEKDEQETDRLPLAKGIRFVMTDAIILPSRNYEFLAKMNGYDLITKDKVKFRTTSKSLIRKLKEEIIPAAGADEAGHFSQEIKVMISDEKSKDGRMYLIFTDPA